MYMYITNMHNYGYIFTYKFIYVMKVQRKRIEIHFCWVLFNCWMWFSIV